MAENETPTEDNLRALWHLVWQARDLRNVAERFRVGESVPYEEWALERDSLNSLLTEVEEAFDLYRFGTPQGVE